MKADIYVDENRDAPPGRFEVRFSVQTEGCKRSACSGFDATLEVFIDEDTIVQQRYSFAGWSAAESSPGEFFIVRNGPLSGLSLHGVDDIESPDIVCFEAED